MDLDLDALYLKGAGTAAGRAGDFGSHSTSIQSDIKVSYTLAGLRQRVEDRNYAVALLLFYGLVMGLYLLIYLGDLMEKIFPDVS